MSVPAISRDPAPTAEVNRRLRVLWLIKGLGRGGAELLLTFMAEVGDRERFDYEAAYLLPWKRALVPELEAAGVAAHCLNGGKEWDLRWALRLRRLLVRGHYDVVHVHSPYVAGIARLVARSLPRAMRPQFVSTEHVPWWGYVAPTRALNALTFRLDAAHIAVSREVADSIPALFRRYVTVAHQGIFPERVAEMRKCRDEVRAELGAGPAEVLIGTVANMRAQKDYPNLLAAARRVIDSGLPVRFIAIGSGQLEAEIRARHRTLGLGNRFQFLGYRPDATRLLAACDVFVLSSVYEGLPLALMEALALGLPIVATAVGGIPEGVTDGVEALLVPAARPDLLAQALGALAEAPERRVRMGKASRKRARIHDIRHVMRGTEDIYRGVVTL